MYLKRFCKRSWKIVLTFFKPLIPKVYMFVKYIREVFLTDAMKFLYGLKLIKDNYMHWFQNITPVYIFITSVQCKKMSFKLCIFINICIFVINQGRKVTIDDENLYLHTRRSYIKLVKAKVSGFD